jgi:hypothetical protein
MKKMIGFAALLLMFAACKKTATTEKQLPAGYTMEQLAEAKNKDYQVVAQILKEAGISFGGNPRPNRAYSYSWFNIPDMPPPYAAQSGNSCGSHAAATVQSKWCRDSKGYQYNDYGAIMSPYYLYDNLLYNGNPIISGTFWYGSTIYTYIRNNGNVNLAWWRNWSNTRNEYLSKQSAYGWIAANYKAPQAAWIPFPYNGVFYQPDLSEIKYAVGNLRRPVAIRMMIPTTGMQLDGNNNYINWNQNIVPWNQHWMVIWGYDDNAQKFNVMNSWGPGWGSYGSCWMPYDALKYNCQEAIYLNY